MPEYTGLTSDGSDKILARDPSVLLAGTEVLVSGEPDGLKFEISHEVYGMLHELYAYDEKNGVKSYSKDEPIDQDKPTGHILAPYYGEPWPYFKYVRVAQNPSDNRVFRFSAFSFSRDTNPVINSFSSGKAEPTPIDQADLEGMIEALPDMIKNKRLDEQSRRDHVGLLGRALRRTRRK